MEIDSKLVWFTVVQHLLNDSSVLLSEVVTEANRITDVFDMRFNQGNDHDSNLFA